LAEFLEDLRAELGRAQANAANEPLKLGVDKVEVTLEVTTTLEGSGEVDGRVKAKFWIFTSAEAGAKGSVTAGRARTQTLTLTLTPALEETATDPEGTTTTVRRGLDVTGRVEQGEENPALPPVPATR
jgi:hypothetical protein